MAMCGDWACRWLCTLHVSAANPMFGSTYPISRIAARAIFSTVAGDRSAFDVISPATTTRSVVTSVSQATRLIGSVARQWSRTASDTWSATLSGWPIDTDSLVNRKRSLTADSGCSDFASWYPIVLCRHADPASYEVSLKESKPEMETCV